MKYDHQAIPTTYSFKLTRIGEFMSAFDVALIGVIREERDKLRIENEKLKSENIKLKKLAFQHCDWDSATGEDLKLLRAIDKEFRPENYNDNKEFKP